ncbi:MAG TPA: sulfite exporter TauE/SafE family protein [Elusimicrobiota bacterium]|nr:sulfite exporter TauE/SafE family protein [Elusimicrobiota bacterium]
MACALLFAVAFLYAAVGHGGASGYIASLLFLGVAKDAAVASALTLNVLVAGTSLWSFSRAGYLRRGLVWPFLLGSIPAAALGGYLKVSNAVFSGFLALALILAGLRMWLGAGSEPASRPAPRGLAVAIGALIGVVSGMIGIGGGVFLSPVLIVAGWADAKEAAAASAAFILANSIAAMVGRVARHAPVLVVGSGTWLAAAWIGGLLGSTLGARWMSNAAVRRTLGAVLWIAGYKLLTA